MTRTHAYPREGLRPVGTDYAMEYAMKMRNQVPKRRIGLTASFCGIIPPSLWVSCLPRPEVHTTKSSMEIFAVKLLSPLKVLLLIPSFAFLHRSSSS